MEEQARPEQLYTLRKNNTDGLMDSYTRKASIIRDETGNHILTAILAAFSYVIALSWRDAIRKIIDSVVITMGVPDTSYFYEIVIAMVITLFCVLGIVLFSKLKGDTEKTY
jgi:hypothetical protein